VTIQTSNEPAAFNDFEHEGWQRASGGYEQYFSQITQQTATAMMDAAGVVAGSRALDVCTGPGVIASALAERGAETVGLDFSSEFIARAKNNVPSAEFHQGDAQNLPFDDGSFDAVVCGYGIIHVPDPRQALLEIRRVLKPGGRAAVSVWDALKPTNGFGVVFGAMQAHGNLDVPLPHGPDFFQFSGDGALVSAIEGVGFKNIEVETVTAVWKIDDPADVIRALMEASVRAHGLLTAQTDAARAKIDAAIIEGMQQFTSAEGGYVIPMPALIGSGHK
jgi:SAM-dependent methyltransferase